ncbi:glycoside hydrolase family 43 protein [Cellulomonas sp. McL0617]|uniref:glycoside hydrolase family 43 protein n=1 Tax=Cellulomonas sp. McL0617 TaxID=3415675 RepID=UPI003CF3A5DD
MSSETTPAAVRFNDVPVLSGFYPDPTICRAGDRYYLANSSFEYLPGVPIHESTDLVTWRQVGNVYDRREQLDLRGAPSGTGTYAPTLRHHDGRFYLITTDITTVMEGQLIASADDPAGPWSVPVRVPGPMGIDPDLFWDVDGSCHMTWAGWSLSGDGGILSLPIDPDTGDVLGEIRRLWQGTGLAHPEGPHLYRIDDTYYCLLAEGGTERGHCVTIARAPSLDGPWESAPHNPILSHRSSTHPVQSTGHGDLVERPDGTWAMVHLGNRPRGRTPAFHVNGRETFVVGVDWVDGWPVVDESRFEVPETDTAFTDGFVADNLDPRWMSPGGVHVDTVRPAPGGGLVISPVDDERPLPALCVRARDEGWRAHIDLASPDGGPGLQVHLDTDNWFEVRLEGGRAVAEVSVAGLRHTFPDTGLEVPVEGLWCAAIAEPPAPYPMGGPDTLAVGVRSGGRDIELARVDGRLVSTEVASGFTGRTIGLRATTGEVRITEFGYAPRAAEQIKP